MPGNNIKSLVQKDIFEEIKNRANEYFTDEETGNYYDDIADIYNEVQEYIDSEIKSCVKVMGTDFKDFHIPKDEFIKGYRDIDDYFFVDNKMWGWIYEEVKKTMDDFQKYNEHKDDSIDNEVFIKLKKIFWIKVLIVDIMVLYMSHWFAVLMSIKRLLKYEKKSHRISPC